jgi:hypothetical protein
MQKRAKITLATLGLSGALAVGIAGPAYAATGGSPASTPTAASTAPTAGKAHTRFGAQFAQDLATQLGVPTAKVTTALQQLRAEHQAQKQGQATDPAQREQQFASKLAAKLGLDGTKVSDAVKTVRAKEKADRQARLKSRLDQAVKSGKISQSDADAYLRVVDSGALAAARK